MNDWHSTWLGRRSLPRDLSGFEIEDRRGPADGSYRNSWPPSCIVEAR